MIIPLTDEEGAAVLHGCAAAAAASLRRRLDCTAAQAVALVALSPEGEEVRGRVEAALAESRERMPDPLGGASGCALPRGLRAWTAAEARRWPGETGRRVARKAGAP